MKDDDWLTRRLSFVASLLSLTTLALSFSGCILIMMDIEDYVTQYQENVIDFLSFTSDTSEFLDDATPGRRFRRQFYAGRERSSSRTFPSETKPELSSNFRSHLRSLSQRNRQGQESSQYPERPPFPSAAVSSSSSYRQSSYMSREKNCDCSITRCPSGPRGPPGVDGTAAIDGLPGEPGKAGTDGIFLLNIECEPCPPGKKGPPGVPGERGPRGRDGVPGEGGSDGVNEPGPPGPAGKRGQPGMNGRNGDPGKPGKDAILLIGQPGKKGPHGPPGFPGPRGDPGKAGDPAPPGKEGPKGPPGEIGEVGQDGPLGLRGPIGSQGDNAGYCECPKKYPEAPPNYRISGSEGVNDFEGESIDDNIPSIPAELPIDRNIPISIDRNLPLDGPPPDPINGIPPPAPFWNGAQNSFGESAWQSQSESGIRDPLRSSSFPSPSSSSTYNAGGGRKTVYALSPNKDARKRYPMLSYRDSREEAKRRMAHRRATASGSNSQVEFDLR